MEMTSLNNGKLIAGHKSLGDELLRPVTGNFGGSLPMRKMRKNVAPRKNYGPGDLLRMQMARQGRKCSVFMDHENLNICAVNRGIKVDFYDLKYYLADESEGRIPQEFFCYVSVDPRREHAKDPVVRKLEDDGWLVKCKRGVPVSDGNYKCGMSVDMAIDIISFAIEARPDIVVLVSGNQDFVAVVRKLRERGIRCEVAAFPENTSQALINSASSFINLEKYSEILAENNESYREDYRMPITEPHYPEFYEDNYDVEPENAACDRGMRHSALSPEKPDHDNAYSHEPQADYTFYDDYEI
jgi:uncharacterized LabA/DUF88 family protein